MRRLVRGKIVALLFEDFHPRLWVLAFIALVCISIAWLAFTRPPPIRPSFHSMFAAFEEEETEPDLPQGERMPLFTAGLRGASGACVEKEIGECLPTVRVDVDGDGRRDRVCVRTAACRTPNGGTLHEALMVDVFKHDHWLLRQEFDPGLFREERFHLLRDLDMDGGAELVTLLSAGPESPGVDTFRIYKFDGYAFVEAMHAFGLPPQDASVAYFLRHLPEVRADITARYMAETGSEDLCGDPGEEGDCFEGSPWLFDSNGDGRLELAQMLEPPGRRSVAKPAPFRLFVKEFRRRGTEGRSRFHALGPGPRGGSSGSIVLRRPEGGRVLVLATFVAPGSAAVPSVASAFEIAGTVLKKAAVVTGATLVGFSARQGDAGREEPLETRDAQ
jgi:hypothetical protein